jgi:hypothetical protein
MFGEEYKLWSCSLCSFLQSPVTSSLFGPSIHIVTSLVSLSTVLIFRIYINHIKRTLSSFMKVLCDETHWWYFNVKICQVIN